MRTLSMIANLIHKILILLRYLMHRDLQVTTICTTDSIGDPGKIINSGY